ncbi:MAG: hypothetical protein AAGK74_19000 [Chloroflexota bacterium]
MDYAMIGKVEKARFYAQEPDRVTFNSFTAIFRGDNNTYNIALSAEGWDCSCPGYHEHGMCPHIMTMERVLAQMLKRPLMPYAPGQNVVSDVDKSIRYATEPHRITFTSFEVTFEGDHNSHIISYDNGKWASDDTFFRSRGYSSHSMAMERILENMLTPVRSS